MGGVGKTALVQQVFEDAKKTGYFDVQAWTCVSDDFDVLAITKKILQTINEDLQCEGKDLNWLQNKLKENISEKKFLVVLDDVWNEEYEKWTLLLRPFQSGEKGSKIILTTRNEDVASLTRADAPPYHLKQLSQDACMTLFAFHALGVENFDHHCHLKVLGQKIAEKCKGLPLAAKTLGGLLRNKVSPQDWEAISNSKIWDLPEGGDKILLALKISYLHLPFHLRRCFAYCAIFPKDYEIEQDELICWWIAEGLLERKKEKDSWNAGNLVGLEILSKFVVGTNNGSRLKELEHLKNLKGELCIIDLHMVREARDAKDVKLCMKEGICRLAMRWNEYFENFRDEELEAKVLDFLCPHENLENLEISYYGGLEFPSWLGSPSYVNIVHLRLHECRRAKALPLLGQLSFLKELYIEGLKAICRVGSEFYGIESPFPSLMTLEFKNMPLWEDWSHYVGSEEIGVLFPCLEHLVIQDCPMLIGRLPSQLNSLRMLEINSCPRMDASSFIISLPSLNELKFRGCNEGVLKSLVNLTSLANLVMEDVAELTCLNHGFTSSLIKLEKLVMNSCKNLMYLWQDKDVIRNLTFLKSLVVNSCPEFISFIVGEGDIELPSNLETMVLRDCINLEKLRSKMHTLSSLRDLTVDRGIESLAMKLNGLESLQEIRIGCCENLRSLPQGLHTLSHLTCLELGVCPALELECFPPLPPAISSFKLWECPKIKSLPNQLHQLTCLRELSILACESITCFPDGGLPPQLKRLYVGGLKNMKQPVREWVTPLTSLETLFIDGSVGGVGEEEDLVLPLPSSLLLLSIFYMEKVERLSSSLPPSLRELDFINCPKLRELPQDGLPPSLESLDIKRCGKLEERCKKETGCYWPLIRQIPCVSLSLSPIPSFIISSPSLFLLLWPPQSSPPTSLCWSSSSPPSPSPSPSHEYILFPIQKQKQITLGIPLGEVCPACEIVPYCGDATAGSAVLHILDFLWKLFPMIRVGSQITHRGIEHSP
ncbi:hypothetical protein BT93_B1817 [Corymbia citriodora subsp. variegata]|nr:hypothetical protein BT93_B1817 [Corymbia citriodora subsp. variegata]